MYYCCYSDIKTCESAKQSACITWAVFIDGDRRIKPFERAGSAHQRGEKTKINQGKRSKQERAKLNVCVFDKSMSDVGERVYTQIIFSIITTCLYGLPNITLVNVELD